MRFGILIAFLCLGLSVPVHAGTVGNPAAVMELKGPGYMGFDHEKFGRLGVGFDAEIIISKDIDGAIASELSGQIYNARIYYTLVDFFEPYFNIGWTNLEAEWTQSGSKIVTQGDSDIGFGGGANFKIWNSEEYKYPIRLSGQASFYYTEPDVDQVKVQGDIASGLTNKKFEVKQWQVALVLSTEYKFDEAFGLTFIPYVGGKYSDSDNEFKATSGSTTYTPSADNNDTLFGLVVGCDIKVNDRASLTAEGRFFDETAVTGGCKFLF